MFAADTDDLTRAWLTQAVTKAAVAKPIQMPANNAILGMPLNMVDLTIIGELEAMQECPDASILVFGLDGTGIHNACECRLQHGTRLGGPE